MNDSASVSTSPALPDLNSQSSGLHLAWVYGIPLVAALLVFAQILTAGWVYDDVMLFQDNPRMHEWGTILFTFQNPFWDITAFQENYTGFYRPIGGSIFVLLFKLSDGNPFVFHLASILVHAWCTVLVVRLALVVKLPRAAALIGGTYFAISGSHVEAVAWASSLPDLLAALFSLLAVLGFLRAKLVMPAVWLILAILSKEAALSTWLLLVAVTLFALPKLPKMVQAAGAPADDQPIAPQRSSRFVMLAIVALVVWLLRWQAFDSPAAGFDKQLTYHYLDPLHQFMVSLGLIAQYITYFVWPWPNFPFRPLQVDLTPADFTLWGPALFGLALLLGSAWIWLTRNRRSALILIGFGLLFAGLAPVLNTKVIGRFPFEQRFLYVPSIGFALLIGYWLYWLGARLPKAAAAIPVAVLAVSNVWSAVDATPNWKGEFAFFTWTRTNSPNAMTPYLNLARLYLTEAESYPPGHPQRLAWGEKAFQEYEASLKVDSSKWLVTSIERENGNFGMGQALFTIGDLGTAEAVYRETLKGYPNSIHAHVGVAQCLLIRVERDALTKSYEQLIPLWEEALVHANKAIGGMQELPDAYHCKSVSLYMLGRREEALEPARRAFGLQPTHYPYVMNLVEILAVGRQFEEMRAVLRQYLAADPNSQYRPEVEETLVGLDQILPPSSSE